VNWGHSAHSQTHWGRRAVAFVAIITSEPEAIIVVYRLTGTRITSKYEVIRVRNRLERTAPVIGRFARGQGAAVVEVLF